MKKSKLTITLALFAVVLISAAGLGKSGAYFTTYAEAEGALTIALGEETRIVETFSDWTKHVSISNAENSNYPVFVRVKAFCASYELTYSGDGWTLGDDGFYYYADPVEAGSASGILDIHIDHVPANIEDPGRKFNVVVVSECTPALYDEDGNVYCDWNDIVARDEYPEE